jgi:hypothetical protein
MKKHKKRILKIDEGLNGRERRKNLNRKPVCQIE